MKLYAHAGDARCLRNEEKLRYATHSDQRCAHEQNLSKNLKCRSHAYAGVSLDRYKASNNSDLL